ncbi:hypothetical protein F5B20DRAFT_564864 [Whalleya microplaca]|nr:hypothetical protein F5B20DRAFT_564864 [Whalleya microplaca]
MHNHHQVAMCMGQNQEGQAMAARSTLLRMYITLMSTMAHSSECWYHRTGQSNRCSLPKSCLVESTTARAGTTTQTVNVSWFFSTDEIAFDRQAFKVRIGLLLYYASMGEAKWSAVLATYFIYYCAVVVFYCIPGMDVVVKPPTYIYQPA